MRLHEGVLVAVKLRDFHLVTGVVQKILERFDCLFVLLVADQVNALLAIVLRLAKRRGVRLGFLGRFFLHNQALERLIFDFLNLPDEQFGRGHAFAAVLQAIDELRVSVAVRLVVRGHPD